MQGSQVCQNCPNNRPDFDGLMPSNPGKTDWTPNTIKENIKVYNIGAPTPICPDAVRETEISHALNRLKGKEEQLRKVWDRVINKIDPILTPVCPEPASDKKCELAMNTVLGKEINSVANKIDDLIDYMEHVIGRIEL
jgi:hypothetical protein